MKLGTAVGIAVVTAHALAFSLLAERCTGTALAVDVRSAEVSPVLSLAGTTPPALADRIELADDAPPGPGLHRTRWSVTYRGGFTRAVGAAQLVGPFQDLGAPPCVGRVVVGQKLLDQAAVTMQRVLEKELAGESVIGAGDYRGIKDLSLRWARLEWHPDDVATVGQAPDGYVRAAATVSFQRVDIPVVIALIPAPVATDEHGLGLTIKSRADLAFDNRVAQWLSDKLGGDKLATRLTRKEIEGALLTVLAPPPPLEVPGGGRLVFGYCAGSPEILEGTSGALPFAVELRRSAKVRTAAPPLRGPAPHVALAPGATLALDLDLDALNAILYDLWEAGYLDRQLATAGLDRAFNEHPLVQQLLTIRMSPVTLALPPTLAPYRGKLRMLADARVTITDRTAAAVGRVWGGLDFAFAPAGLVPASVDLSALELSCEQTATTLVPCYADLVDVIRDHGAEVHGTLSEAFAQLLRELFVDRHLSTSELPAELVIKSAVPRLTSSGTGAGANASLHLDLIGELH